MTMDTSNATQEARQVPTSKAHEAVKAAWPSAFEKGERFSKDGRTLTDYFCCGGERYPFDQAHCGTQSDWYQFDTRQDASFYGTWVNPVLRAVVCYCEGDISVSELETADGYRAYIAELNTWCADSGHAVRECGIDNHDGRHWIKLMQASLADRWDSHGWVETTETLYDEMLGAVPPLKYITHGFIVGEAWTFDRETGHPTYWAFRNVGGRFEMMVGTVKEIEDGAAKGGAV